VPTVTCLRAEADTGIQPCSPYSVYSVLLSDGYTAAVLLDTEDMDNYVQAALFADRQQESCA